MESANALSDYHWILVPKCPKISVELPLGSPPPPQWKSIKI
ncbi:hypothetical protein COLO4_15332 [Corchorus olitorius]|uniref:Uncharacterized protein n=1 Tax=Corchorus olitorius TaxID=93759 RepID=A0A1R3JNA6_9ROSI|nr:hypothetical protein COLO4_15332 [Corchorus olitorius]